MSPALFYHPEAYTTGQKLMGRNAAGESFLRGFLAHSTAKEFAIQVLDGAHSESFLDAAKTYGRNEPVSIIDKTTLGKLRSHGVVYHPGPGIAEHSRQRSIWGADKWSLCGITHTTSSARAMDSIAQLISAPIQPWDAVICTSRAVKQNVEYILEREAAYFADRLGATRSVLPQLPVIPLGIHSDDFEFSDAEQTSARRALAINAEDIVVLFMGRLSFHAKAHPYPMYVALEHAAEASGKRVTLVECGWHGNEAIRDAFTEAANILCPSVRVVHLDGRVYENRSKAWACADVFCSFSDNIQETFGISPIEGMAAGLPVVVSDWDGYKDTVRDGVDGFRIPTAMPRGDLGGDLAIRHALELDTYDMYIGHCAMLTSVDISAATRAFEALFKSESLRKKLGSAGKARAKSQYDWASIIPQYEDLWQELNRIRGAPANKTVPSWPSRPDPFEAFANYSTHTLSEGSRLIAASDDVVFLTATASRARELKSFAFARYVLPSQNEVRLIIDAAMGAPVSALSLVEAVDISRRSHVFRGLGWLLKIGVLQLVSDSDPAPCL